MLFNLELEDCRDSIADMANRKREFERLSKLIEADAEKELQEAQRQVEKKKKERLKQAAFSLGVEPPIWGLKTAQKQRKIGKKAKSEKASEKGFSRADKIREAVAQQQGTFFAKEITAEVQKSFPDIKHSSVSASLIRMEGKVVKKHGKKGKEVIYEKL